MSIRNLKTLIAIADHGSFTAAAGVVNVTHAAVSHQMKALEEDWGVQLFNRSTRTPELTPIGRALVSKARDVVAGYDGMVLSVTSEIGFRGNFSIGAVPTTLSGLMPAILRLLREEHPALFVRVVPGLTTELIAQVECGALDAAIISLPMVIPKTCNWREIVVEPMELIASQDAEGDDPVELLKSYPYIRFTRRAVVGAMIENWLQKQDFDVGDSMELETLDAIGSMVCENLGVAIVPRQCVPAKAAHPLRHLPFDPPPPSRVLGLLSWGDTVKPKVLDAVFDKAVEAVEAASKTPAR